MEPINPLALPELLKVVGQYLDHRSLASCLCVSRTWHDLLLPYLWHDLEIDWDQNVYPPEDIIKKNASHIRKLSMNGIPPSDISMVDCSFPRLSVLVLAFDDQENHHNIYSAFIKENASSLTNVTTNETTPEILNALGDCPNLKRLQLHSFWIRETSIDNELEIWPLDGWIRRYQSLWCKLLFFSVTDWPPWEMQSSLFKSLQPSWIKTHGQNPTNADVKQIQELRLLHSKGRLEGYSWLIEQCPDLKRLSWIIPHQRPGQEQELSLIRSIADWIQAGSTCQHLEDLALVGSMFRNEDWARFLSLIRRLSCLDLNASSFNVESWNILQSHPRHLATLRGLDLKKCYHVTGKAIQAMMCEMPNLEAFHMNGVLSTLDLLEDPRPWACLGLKELSLKFMEVPEGIGREILSLPLDQRTARIAQSRVIKDLFTPSEEKEASINNGLDSLSMTDKSLPLNSSSSSSFYSSSSSLQPLLLSTSPNIFSRVAGLRSLEVLRAFSILDLNETPQGLKVVGRLDQWRGALGHLRELGRDVSGVGIEERQWFLENWPLIDILIK